MLGNSKRAHAGHVITKYTLAMHAEDSRFVKDAQRLQVPFSKTQVAALQRESKKVRRNGADMLTTVSCASLSPSPFNRSHRVVLPRPSQPEKAANALAKATDAEKERVVEALAAAQESFRRLGGGDGDNDDDGDDEGTVRRSP